MLASTQDRNLLVGTWRRQTLVAAVAGLLVTAVVCLSISSVLLWKARERTRRAQQRAEANFDVARQALDEMLAELSEEQPAHEPGLERKRRTLLLRARRYYRNFLEQGLHDPRLQAEAARAHLRLGDIARLLDEFPEARRDYEEAIDLLQEQTATADDTDLLFALADAHHSLGEVYRRGRLIRDPIREYRRCLEVLDRLQQREGDTPAIRARRAQCQDSIGIVFGERHERRQALAAFDAAIALLRDLATDAREHPKDHRHLARAYYLHRGPVLRQEKRPGEAVKDYERAVGLLEELGQVHPEVADYRHELGAASINLGDVYRDLGRLAEANASHRRAKALFDHLARAHPYVPTYQAELGNACVSLGMTLFHASESAVALARAPLLLSPAWPDRLLAAGTGSLGAVLRGQAQREWETARTLFDQLVRTSDTPQYRALRGQVSRNLGMLFLRERRPIEARKVLQQAVADLNQAAADQPANVSYAALRKNAQKHLELAQRLELKLTGRRP